MKRNIFLTDEDFKGEFVESVIASSASNENAKRLLIKHDLYNGTTSFIVWNKSNPDSTDKEYGNLNKALDKYNRIYV